MEQFEYARWLSTKIRRSVRKNGPFDFVWIKRTRTGGDKALWAFEFSLLGRPIIPKECCRGSANGESFIPDQSKCHLKRWLFDMHCNGVIHSECALRVILLSKLYGASLADHIDFDSTWVLHSAFNFSRHVTC